MSFKRKISALIIASISATSLPSYAAPTNMADQIFRKTPAISAAALSLIATAGTLITGDLWYRRQEIKYKIDELHSLKGNVESNKTIEIANYPCLSSQSTLTEYNVTYPSLLCTSSNYSQPGNASTRQLIPSENFSDCIDREIKEYQHDLSDTRFFTPIFASFSAAVSAIATLNIFTALKQKNYIIKPLRHNA